MMKFGRVLPKAKYLIQPVHAMSNTQWALKRMQYFNPFALPPYVNVSREAIMSHMEANFHVCDENNKKKLNEIYDLVKGLPKASDKSFPVHTNPVINGVPLSDDHPVHARGYIFVGYVARYFIANFILTCIGFKYTGKIIFNPYDEIPPAFVIAALASVQLPKEKKFSEGIELLSKELSRAERIFVNSRILKKEDAEAKWRMKLSNNDDYCPMHDSRSRENPCEFCYHKK